MASDYFTTTPEMKATVEMAAAAVGNYAAFQVPVHGSMVPVSVPVLVEGSDEQYQKKVRNLMLSEIGYWIICISSTGTGLYLWKFDFLFEVHG